MKKTSLTYCLAITSLMITAITIPPTSAATKAKTSKPQMAGRIAVTPSNTILNGFRAPKSSLGIDGDFYIDAKAMNLYGPKANGRWPTAISLRGPQGQTGATGNSGNNGKSGAKVLTVGPVGSPGPSGAKGDVGVTGAKGEMGALGSAGPVGSKGETGPAGSTGPAGAVGGMGANGAQGPAGAVGGIGANGAQGPAGANGSNGAQGFSGPQGVQGTAGATGAAGAAGSPGATGPSNSIIGSIGFAAVIQGVPGTSQISNPFGSFEKGKNYVLRVNIRTFNTGNLASVYPLSLNVSAIGATPTISTFYSIVNGTFWISGAKQDSVSIIAEITIDGSATASAYQLVATVTCGLNSGTVPISLTGNYSTTLVGQII